MNFSLTQSDWIAILVGLFQLLGTTLLVLWQVNKTTTKASAAAHPARKEWPLLAQWLFDAWPLLLFMGFAFWSLHQQSAAAGPVTREVVASMVYAGLLGMANGILALVFLILERQRRMNVALVKLMQHMNDIHQGMSEAQKKTVTVLGTTIGMVERAASKPASKPPPRKRSPT